MQFIPLFSVVYSITKDFANPSENLWYIYSY